MERKDFIKAGILTGAGLSIAKLISASESDSLNMKPICIYDNYLKGTMYYQKAIQKIDFSASLAPKLVREPENKYDHFAIAVYVQDMKIGYLPAYENVVIAKMLDAGVEIQVFINIDQLEKIQKNDYIRDSIYVQLYTELLTSRDNMLQKDLDNNRSDDVNDRYRQGFRIEI